MKDDPRLPRRSHTQTAHDLPSAHAPHGKLAVLAIGALGVVYGDIGTSPLYAIDQIFIRPAGVTPTPENVLGAISLAIWTITLIVAVKYALLVLRAENDGEGGVFALYGLLHKYKNQGAQLLLWSLMLGAGLLVGDGMITPAISVLSAVEGLNVATPAFAPYVLPITVALLTGLLTIQFKGASGVGVIFGPLLIADQSAERTACLRLAETVTDFLARLRSSAGTLDVSERQRVLRLLVKDILVGDDKIVIRHSIPLPTN
jgi:K+ transporter